MAPGATEVMVDIEGAGCIRHIWMTTRCHAPQYLRKLVLEMYWDGEAWPPSLHGTGTEDYFGAAWGFPSGEYDGPYHGISLGSDVQGTSANEAFTVGTSRTRRASRSRFA